MSCFIAGYETVKKQSLFITSYETLVTNVDEGIFINPAAKCSFFVETQRRGPILSIVMSLMKLSDDDRDNETDNINVNDLAGVKVMLKGKNNDRDIAMVIGSKKNEAAKNLTVSLNVSTEGTTKQFFCQDEWTEVPITNNCKYIAIGGNSYTCLLYSVKVDITMQVTLPVAPPMNNHLYEDTECTDFKLQATDGVVAFHKAVLFVQSEMFRTMLRGEWKENAEGNMNMNGESVQTLQHLKDFMYLGTVPDEGLEPLLLLARRCLMDNLAAACINKLISTVKPETFDGLAEFASQNNIVELVKAFARIPHDVVTGIRWFQWSLTEGGRVTSDYLLARDGYFMPDINVTKLANLLPDT